MADNTAKELNASSDSSTQAKKLFEQKACQNLFIALTGPIGSSIENAAFQWKILLQDFGYEEIHIIKLSKFLPELKQKLSSRFHPSLIETGASENYVLYREKQDSGNNIRRIATEPAILAHLAIKEISVKRLQHADKHLSPDVSIEGKQEYASAKKLAFIIDQLKRPEEVEVLRLVYKDLFYLCAVSETESTRQNNLRTKGIKPIEAAKLMELDRKDDNKDWGQLVQKTFHEADFFLNANNLSVDDIQKKLRRFLKLIHGHNGFPPTQEEFGMYQAHTASLGSLCLSRQVGAAILDAEGNVLSIGRNDVPKYGGGLYENTDNPSDKEDMRCVYSQGYCRNTRKQIELKDDIISQINELISDEKKAKKIFKIINDSKIGDLMEFSRSIHAEMDAIISLARKGIRLGKETSLYTTTYPCHMCARHIITAGLEHVIYIEPYEKSLALELHGDSIINHDNYKKESSGAKIDKVKIRAFNGVAPRRYQFLFLKVKERKLTTGEAVFHDDKELPPLTFQHTVTNYELEGKIIKDLQDSPLGLLA